jgi:hypothetical protein
MNEREGVQVQVRQTGSEGCHAHKTEVDDGIDIGAGGDESTNDRTNGARTNGAATVSRNDSGGARYEGHEGLEALCSNCDVLCAEDAAAIGTAPPVLPPYMLMFTARYAVVHGSLTRWSSWSP